jgi:hypothetical protein
MFEAFSDGYYLGRLYVEPYDGDRPAMQRAQHERVNERVYATGEGVERTDAPLVMKLEDCHFPVHGATDVPADTLALPDDLLAEAEVDRPGTDLDAPAEAARESTHAGLANARNAFLGWVSEVVSASVRRDRSPDGLRDGQVHVGHPKREHVVVHGIPFRVVAGPQHLGGQGFECVMQIGHGPECTREARTFVAVGGRLAAMETTIEIPSWAAYVVSDHTDMDRDPHPVDASKVSSFTLELPDDVYFEYGFMDADGEIRPDPNNDGRAENPWYPNASALTGPDYAPDPYAQVDTDRATGELRRHRWESERLGEVRRVNVYTPDGYDGPLPTIVLQDGTAYMRVARLPAVLEALLADGVVAPARLVMIEPVDRVAEYGFDDTYRSFVTDEVLPRGGTDAAAIQQSRAGVASVTLSTPSRYVHTVTEMVAKRDLEAAVTLLGAFLSDADAARAPDA